MVASQVRNCTNCSLHKKCKAPVPLDGGTPNIEGDGLLAKFIVVGEAPGQVENKRGRPFMGPAGQLLRSTLRKCGAHTDDAVFMNVVSCFPTDHQTPTAEEINHCRNNLRAQMDVVEADFVLVTGATALTSLLPHGQLKYMRDRPIQAHGRTLFPVYHPSYILRDESAFQRWRMALERFVLMTKGIVEADWLGDWPNCLYCRKLRVEGTQTCRNPTHIRNWRKDREWKAFHYQPNLFPS